MAVLHTHTRSFHVLRLHIRRLFPPHVTCRATPCRCFSPSSSFLPYYLLLAAADTRARRRETDVPKYEPPSRTMFTAIRPAHMREAGSENRQREHIVAPCRVARGQREGTAQRCIVDARENRERSPEAQPTSSRRGKRVHRLHTRKARAAQPTAPPR